MPAWSWSSTFYGILFRMKTLFLNKLNQDRIFWYVCMHICIFLKLSFFFIYQKNIDNSYILSLLKSGLKWYLYFAHWVVLYLHKPIPITFENRMSAIFIPFYESYKLLDGSLFYSIGGMKIFFCAKYISLFCLSSCQKA